MSRSVGIAPWGPEDRALLAALTGDPAMMRHLGGPESPEQIAVRQRRYEAPGSGMFAIVDLDSGRRVGSAGFWEREWSGERVFETGWSVLPAFQGRGYASAGVAQVIAQARADGRHPAVHAFPSVDNPASNAICRKLGFTLVGACSFEYPPGSSMECNDWRLVLSAR